LYIPIELQDGDSQVSTANRSFLSGDEVMFLPSYRVILLRGTSCIFTYTGS